MKSRTDAHIHQQFKCGLHFGIDRWFLAHVRSVGGVVPCDALCLNSVDDPLQLDSLVFFLYAAVVSHDRFLEVEAADCTFRHFYFIRPGHWDCNLQSLGSLFLLSIKHGLLERLLYYLDPVGACGPVQKASDETRPTKGVSEKVTAVAGDDRMLEDGSACKDTQESGPRLTR